MLVLYRSPMLFLLSALNVLLRRRLGLLTGLVFAALAARLLSCIRWVARSTIRFRVAIVNPAADFECFLCLQP